MLFQMRVAKLYEMGSVTEAAASLEIDAAIGSADARSLAIGVPESFR